MDPEEKGERWSASVGDRGETDEYMRTRKNNERPGVSTRVEEGGTEGGERTRAGGVKEGDGE